MVPTHPPFPPLAPGAPQFVQQCHRALLDRLRYRLLLAAPLCFALALVFYRLLPDGSIPAQWTLTLLVTYLNRWCWILAVLAWGYRCLNRPLRWLPYTNEAAYPWYILHQTITVAAGYQLARLSLGPVLEPLLLLTATVGGCLLLHEFVIRRTPLLRPLFGLKPLAKQEPLAEQQPLEKKDRREIRGLRQRA